MAHKCLVRIFLWKARLHILANRHLDVGNNAGKLSRKLHIKEAKEMNVSSRSRSRDLRELFSTQEAHLLYVCSDFEQCSGYISSCQTSEQGSNGSSMYWVKST